MKFIHATEPNDKSHIYVIKRGHGPDHPGALMIFQHDPKDPTSGEGVRASMPMTLDQMQELAGALLDMVDQALAEGD